METLPLLNLSSTFPLLPTCDEEMWEEEDEEYEEWALRSRKLGVGVLSYMSVRKRTNG
jgi:hypothetical protein